MRKMNNEEDCHKNHCPNEADCHKNHSSVGLYNVYQTEYYTHLPIKQHSFNIAIENGQLYPVIVDLPINSDEFP